MTIEAIELDQIHDNPYQARLIYHRKDIDDLAHSIETHGLLQVPPGRRIDGNVELGFGHLRKRAFIKLSKKESEKFGKMPVDIRELSDEQMALFALEENLKRAGLTPLETARAVDHYLNSFLAKTEVELAESLNMAKSTVSNMRRVLRLPEKFLGKIDEGVISFTQGRELLTLEGIPDAEEHMSSALAGINTTGNKRYSEQNTVEGLQRSIHGTIKSNFPPLDKDWESYRYDLLFDTRAAGCLKCDKCIVTHPTKSQGAHFCTDEECWKQKTDNHKAKAAAAAKAKMQAEVLERAAKDVAERTPEPVPDISPGIPQFTLEKRGTSWIALDAQGVVIAIDTTKEKADAGAVACFSPVATKINPDYGDYGLNHTYRFMEKPGSRKLEYFDVTAQDLSTAAKALGVDVENIAQVKVWKSSGKLGTGGGVSAGWSKCTEPLEDVLEQLEEKSVQWRCGQCNVYFEFSPPGDNKALVECPSCLYEYVTYRRADGVLFCLPKHNYALLPKVKIPSTLLSAADEEQSEDQADERDRHMEEARERANLERPVGELPCETCTFGNTCERTYFRVSGEDDRYICDKWECDHVSWALPTETSPAGPDDLQEISRRIAEAPAPAPQDILTLAKEAAGTRAELLDMNDISSGTQSWNRQMNQGYVLLNQELRYLEEPEECLKQCTHGFHYAFNSRQPDDKDICVCSDPKCLGKKKAALTRQRNAAGQARKNLERKAIQEAIGGAGTRPKGLLLLLVYTQVKGRHISNYFYGQDKSPNKWLWDKVSSGTKESERTVDFLITKLDKYEEADLRKLVAELCFYYLVDHGDTGSYQIKTESPLKWLGVDLHIQEEKEPVAAGIA